MKTRIPSILWLLVIVWLVTLACQAQTLTNVIYGNVGDYGLAPQRKVNVTLTLVSPNPRTINNIQIRQDPISIPSDTNGYYAFTNIQWGSYTYSLSGQSGTVFKLQIFTNDNGSIPISSRTYTVAVAQPNPASNYYTMSQSDARYGSTDWSALTGSQWYWDLSGFSDSGFIAAHASDGETAYGWGNHADAGYAYASSLATVATSGNYSDLSGTPNLANVATSGNYSDLSGTPDLSGYLTSVLTDGTTITGDGVTTALAAAGGGSLPSWFDGSGGGYNSSAAFSLDASGNADATVSIGFGANGSSYGAAVGEYANGSSAGAAVGYSANGSSDGAAVGYDANGSSDGVAIGQYASGSGLGNIALGGNDNSGANADATGGGTFTDTCEIGRGAATKSGALHYRGNVVVDGSGNFGIDDSGSGGGSTIPIRASDTGATMYLHVTSAGVITATSSP